MRRIRLALATGDLRRYGLQTGRGLIETEKDRPGFENRAGPGGFRLARLDLSAGRPGYIVTITRTASRRRLAAWMQAFISMAFSFT